MDNKDLLQRTPTLIIFAKQQRKRNKMDDKDLLQRKPTLNETFVVKESLEVSISKNSKGDHEDVFSTDDKSVSQEDVLNVNTPLNNQQSTSLNISLSKQLKGTPARTPTKDADTSLTSPTEANKLPEERKMIAAKRKSKRRSSFVCGRINKHPKLLSSSELCENISLELPEDERLAKLVEDVFEFSIQQLQGEMGEEMDNFQQLVVKARNSLSVSISKMQKDGLFLHATSKDRTLPNPINQKMDASIKSMDSYRVCLQRELDEWKHILLSQEQMANDAEKKYTLLESHPIIRSDCSLTSRQQSIFDNQPNYQSAIDDLYNLKAKTVVAIDEIASSCRILSAFHKKATSILEGHNSLLSGSDMQNADPVDLIRNSLKYK